MRRKECRFQDPQDIQTCKASAQSSADCLAFVSILGQPGSSLSQSPQPQTWACIFSLSLHRPEPQKWPSTVSSCTTSTRLGSDFPQGQEGAVLLGWTLDSKGGGELLLQGRCCHVMAPAIISTSSLTHLAGPKHCAWSPSRHSQKGSGIKFFWGFLKISSNCFRESCSVVISPFALSPSGLQIPGGPSRTTSLLLTVI